jgi:hypothetical protein
MISIAIVAQVYTIMTVSVVCQLYDSFSSVSLISLLDQEGAMAFASLPRWKHHIRNSGKCQFKFSGGSGTNNILLYPSDRASQKKLGGSCPKCISRFCLTTFFYTLPSFTKKFRRILPKVHF